MKSKRKNAGIIFSGFVLFFLTLAVSTMCSVLIYDRVNKQSGGNLLFVALALLACIVFCAIFCVVVDAFRRRFMVERPVEEILEATEKITKGDFNVHLGVSHSYEKFDSFDRIKQNINEMAEELSKNEVLKTDFISNVSHEIKTPLSVIQNYAMILQDNSLSEETRKEYVKNLIHATKHLSSLITNILKLNKLENQKIVPEIQEFDLGELVRGCVINFEELIEKKNLKLECHIPDIKITSCASYIELAVNNLLSNAIKFTEGGKITVRLSTENKLYKISVSDTGCGISSETGEHIFDKFYQGDASHSTEGNGLGLALVKKVIDVLGGRIEVESELNKGSTFTIILSEV